MAKVFIVTAGEYSDYGISQVFSTREKAEQYIDTKDDDYRIEEFELDEPFEVEKKIFAVTLRIEDKNVIRISIEDYNNVEDCIEFNEGCSYDSVRQPNITFFIKSDSKERAIKVASERFGSVIANEAVMYPYLRMRVIARKVYSWTDAKYPYYDFKTGNIVLSDKETYLTNQVPGGVKFIRKKSVYY